MNRKDEFFECTRHGEAQNGNASNDDVYDRKARKKARRDAKKLEDPDCLEWTVERYEEYHDLHQ